MKGFFKRNLSLLLFCLLSLFVLLFKIESSPPLINQDEASFANSAFNISTNLHDENGRFLPLYFETLSTRITDWKNPFLIYWTAIFIKVFGFSTFSTRLASVLLGLIALVFLWKTVELLFPGKKYLPPIISLFMLTSPLFFLQSRINIDPIALVPLTMAEIYFLLRYRKSSKLSDLLIASVIAGINFYTYTPARLYSVLILFVAIAIFSPKPSRPIISHQNFQRYVLPFMIVLLFFLPTVIWEYFYPFRVTQRYSTMLLPLNLENITSGFLNNYLRYFDPSFLFGTGDVDLLHSTGRAGVFLFSGLIFFIVGLYVLITKWKDKISQFLLVLVVLYPLGLFITKDPYRACRGIYVLNLFPLVFAYGIVFLSNHYKKILLLCIAALFLQIPIVYFDLYHSYPIRTRLTWPYRYQLATQTEEILLLAKDNPESSFFIDDAIYFGIDDLTYYQNIHGIRPQNIYFTDDIGIASKSGSLLLTNRVTGEGNVPDGSKIRSGWDGYYILEKK